MKNDIPTAAKSRADFIKHIKQLDGYDLDGGCVISITEEDYDPHSLRQWWSKHKPGIAIGIFVTDGEKTYLTDSVKIWDDGFDSGLKTDSGPWEPILLRHNFPFVTYEQFDIADMMIAKILQNAEKKAEDLKQETHHLPLSF